MVPQGTGTWINEQHLKLCRDAAPTFLEEKRAQYMLERFRELGWEPWIDRAGNVLAALPGRRLRSGDSHVAVTAHLDTVLAPRIAEDISVSPQDRRFLGPGVSDNGTGLTALLALAAVWNEFPELMADALRSRRSWWPMLARRGKGIFPACGFSAAQMPPDPRHS